MKRKKLINYLFFTSILGLFFFGVTSVKALDWVGSYYFDNSNSQWSNVAIGVGHSSWKSSYPMVQEPGTMIYHYTKVGAWNGADGYYFYDGNYNDSGISGDYFWYRNQFGVNNTIKIDNNKDNQCYVPSGNGDDVDGIWTCVPLKNIQILDNFTSYVGGSGTIADPYLVAQGTSIEVKGESEFIYDVDGVKQYAFYKDSYGSFSTSATFSIATLSESVNDVIEVKVKARNARPGQTESSAFESSTSLYYKIINPTLSINTSSLVPTNGNYEKLELTLSFNDLSTYHFLSVPFNVTSTVAADSGSNALDYNDNTNSRKYAIYEYNSSRRASSGADGSNWSLVADPNTLQAGKGYIIGFNTTISTPITIQFTSEENITITDTSQEVLADLTETLPEDDNWYLVGSSLYDNASLTASGLNYFQTYNGTSYDVKLLSANETVPKYSSVFVQYSGTMDMAYPVSGVQSNVVSSSNKSTYILSLSDQSSRCRAIVIGAQDGNMTYQYGKDLLQMPPLSTSTMDLSIPHTSGKLVVDYIEDASAQIALYNKVSDNTPYTISLSGDYTADNVILHDTYLNIDTDLKVTDYTFDGVANQPNRFTLEIVVNKIPTELDRSIYNKVSVSTELNNIIVQSIPEGSQVSVTNAVGQIVRRYSFVENQLIISDLDKGIYFVSIEGEINQVVKILLK